MENNESEKKVAKKKTNKTSSNTKKKATKSSSKSNGNSTTRKKSSSTKAKKKIIKDENDVLVADENSSANNKSQEAPVNAIDTQAAVLEKSEEIPVEESLNIESTKKQDIKENYGHDENELISAEPKIDEIVDNDDSRTQAINVVSDEITVSKKTGFGSSIYKPFTYISIKDYSSQSIFKSFILIFLKYGLSLYQLVEYFSNTLNQKAFSYVRLTFSQTAYLWLRLVFFMTVAEFISGLLISLSASRKMSVSKDFLGKCASRWLADGLLMLVAGLLLNYNFVLGLLVLSICLVYVICTDYAIFHYSFNDISEDRALIYLLLFKIDILAIFGLLVAKGCTDIFYILEAGLN